MLLNGLDGGPHLCLRPIFVILAVKNESFEREKKKMTSTLKSDDICLFNTQTFAVKTDQDP